MPCRITPYQERMWRIAREQEQRRLEAQERRRERIGERTHAWREAEWKQFGAQVPMARRQQMNAAFWRHYEDTFSDQKSFLSAATSSAGNNFCRAGGRMGDSA